VLAETVDSFDQAAYTEGLVSTINAKLEGTSSGASTITASDITLTITSASIVVTATIAMPAGTTIAEADGLVSAISTITPAELSTAVGATVESLSLPVVETAEDDGSGGGGGMGGGAIAGIIIGILIALAAAAGFVYLRKKRSAAPKVAAFPPSA